MRASVAALIGCALLAARGDVAAATEWVVLRVERVEVAVAHADGTPWDDPNDTGLECGAGVDDVLTSPSWGPVVKGFCPPRGSDPKAPDLRLRFVAEQADFISPIARNALAHDFMYELLVPLEAIPADGLAIEVIDQDDSDPRAGEVLGSVRVKVADIKDLLVSSSRIKTMADDSVTRLEITARHYAPSAQQKIKINGKRRVARFAGSVIAGELVRFRATKGPTFPTVVIGGSLDRLIAGRCMMALVQTSGPVAAGLDDDDNPTSVLFERKTLKPSLAQWRRSRGWNACYGGSGHLRSLVTVGPIAPTQTSLTSNAVQTVIDSRYRNGIQRCHERELKVDAMLVGKATLRFTVGPTGGVTRASVKGLKSSLDTCIQDLTLKWRFPAPKDSNGKPTSADLQVPLTLDVR